jgi:hypothetical protein
MADAWCDEPLSIAAKHVPTQAATFMRRNRSERGIGVRRPGYADNAHRSPNRRIAAWVPGPSSACGVELSKTIVTEDPEMSSGDTGHAPCRASPHSVATRAWPGKVAAGEDGAGGTNAGGGAAGPCTALVEAPPWPYRALCGELTEEAHARGESTRVEVDHAGD